MCPSTVLSLGKNENQLNFLKMCSGERFKCSQTDDYILMCVMENELYFPVEVRLLSIAHGMVSSKALVKILKL